MLLESSSSFSLVAAFEVLDAFEVLEAEGVM
jgi:hypothetical protein